MGVKIVYKPTYNWGGHPVGYMMVYVYMEVSINGVTSKASLGEWQLEVIYMGIPRNGQSPSSLDGLFHGLFHGKSINGGFLGTMTCWKPPRFG